MLAVDWLQKQPGLELARLPGAALRHLSVPSSRDEPFGVGYLRRSEPRGGL